MLKSDAHELFRNEVAKRYTEGNATELLSYLEEAWETTAAASHSSKDEVSDVRDGQEATVKPESHDGGSEWDPLILWICPSLDLLEDIADQVRAAGLTAATSVGCGTGLLEWLLAALTGLRVTGLEVNRDWWASKYSPPTFIKHVYADEDEINTQTANNSSIREHFDLNEDQLQESGEEQSFEAATKGYVIPSTHALISCYFNSINVFRSYLFLYRGPLVILIGSAGGLRNTEPAPLDLQNHPHWLLRCVRPVHRLMHDSDQMAVYTRRR